MLRPLKFQCAGFWISSGHTHTHTLGTRYCVRWEVQTAVMWPLERVAVCVRACAACTDCECKERLREDIFARASASRCIIIRLLQWDRQSKATCDCYSNYALQGVSPHMMMMMMTITNMQATCLTRLYILGSRLCSTQTGWKLESSVHLRWSGFYESRYGVVCDEATVAWLMTSSQPSHRLIEENHAKFIQTSPSW